MSLSRHIWWLYDVAAVWESDDSSIPDEFIFRVLDFLFLAGVFGFWATDEFYSGGRFMIHLDSQDDCDDPLQLDSFFWVLKKDLIPDSKLY